MRHRDTRSTDNYYHVYSETLLNAVQKIDNVVDIRTAKNSTNSSIDCTEKNTVKEADRNEIETNF
jgi:hypothetical protein